MCRLFGLHAGREPVSATFWLLDAPKSLLEQSHRNPDGFGLGTFEPDGTAEVDKQPLAAHLAELFAREAREESSTTYVAHVRYASVGELTLENTHPFVLDGRIFGHNGVLGDLDVIEEAMGPELRAALVGDTDSERFFALLTRHIRDHDGDVRAGIVSATRWLAENVELYSLNFVLATPTELYALRYPEGNELWALPHEPTDEPLNERGSYGEIAMQMDEARDRKVVIVASEQMDDDPRWAEIKPGELLRVGPDLEYSLELILPDPPAHLMELTGREAASQAESVGG